MQSNTLFHLTRYTGASRQLCLPLMRSVETVQDTEEEVSMSRCFFEVSCLHE